MIDKHDIKTIYNLIKTNMLIEPSDTWYIYEELFEGILNLSVFSAINRRYILWRLQQRKAWNDPENSTIEEKLDIKPYNKEG